MRTLEQLITVIDERLAGIEATEPGVGATADEYLTRIRACDRVAQTLIDELAATDKAHFRRAGDAYRLAMAGVASECTSGKPQLLRNWQNAARRRLAKEG